ncbi:hypothetical protein ACFRFL_39680 [Streptomyces sp. NPDC056708]|uniref:hypothetical protein n=1 Tax=unclassified Streptomyces TaxID=2593676 RepID=UPI0036812BB5
MGTRTVLDGTVFDPFLHEIVDVEQVDDPHVRPTAGGIARVSAASGPSSTSFAIMASALRVGWRMNVWTARV